MAILLSTLVQRDKVGRIGFQTGSFVRLGFAGVTRKDADFFQVEALPLGWTQEERESNCKEAGHAFVLVDAAGEQQMLEQCNLLEGERHSASLTILKPLSD